MENGPTPPEVEWRDLPAHLSEEAYRVMEALMDMYAREVHADAENHPEESVFLPGILPMTIEHTKIALIDLWNAGLVRFCHDEGEGSMGLEVWLPTGTWKRVAVERPTDD